jgi:hypothetical protein
MKRVGSDGAPAYGGGGGYGHGSSNNNAGTEKKRVRYDDEDVGGYDDMDMGMGDDEIAYESIGDIEPDAGLDAVSDSRWRRKAPLFNPACQNLGTEKWNLSFMWVNVLM